MIKFGKLTVASDKFHSKQLFICDCGKLVIRRRIVVTSGHTKSCGCLIKENCRKVGESNTGKLSYRSNNWKGYHDIPGDFIGCIRRAAKSRNLEFKLTIQDLWNLWGKQEGKCRFTGIPLQFCSDKYLKKKLQTASIDRIDSKKGYTTDNIQFVHKDINIMKQQFTDVEFIYFCTKITLFKKTNNNKKCETVRSTFLTTIKNSAKHRGINFELTLDDINNVFLKQNGECAYSGLDLSFSKTKKYGRREQTASIDRTDSSKGYTIDNIKFVHKCVNVIKQDLSEQAFLSFCKTVFDICNRELPVNLFNGDQENEISKNFKSL